MQLKLPHWLWDSTIHLIYNIWARYIFGSHFAICEIGSLNIIPSTVQRRMELQTLSEGVGNDLSLFAGGFHCSPFPITPFKILCSETIERKYLSFLFFSFLISFISPSLFLCLSSFLSFSLHYFSASSLPLLSSKDRNFWDLFPSQFFMVSWSVAFPIGVNRILTRMSWNYDPRPIECRHLSIYISNH